MAWAAVLRLENKKYFLIRTNKNSKLYGIVQKDFFYFYSNCVFKELFRIFKTVLSFQKADIHEADWIRFEKSC